MRFEHVDWFATHITDVERWGSSCPCEIDHGNGVACHLRGRLLPFAWQYASAALQNLLEQVSQWEPERFSMDMDFLQTAEASVRATVARAYKKIHFLDRVPYLLARLDQGPTHAQRALAQYAEVPPEMHHRATLGFLVEGSPLRHYVLALAEGGDLRPFLESKVRWLQDIPLDDSVAEAPHAARRRWELKARGSKFAWLASSHRLDQNLRDVSAMAPMLDVPLQCIWNEYLRVPSFQQDGRLRVGHEALGK